MRFSISQSKCKHTNHVFLSSKDKLQTDLESTGKLRFKYLLPVPLLHKTQTLTRSLQLLCRLTSFTKKLKHTFWKSFLINSTSGRSTTQMSRFFPSGLYIIWQHSFSVKLWNSFATGQIWCNIKLLEMFPQAGAHHGVYVVRKFLKNDSYVKMKPAVWKRKRVQLLFCFLFLFRFFGRDFHF